MEQIMEYIKGNFSQLPEGEWILDRDKVTGDEFRIRELIVDERSGLTVLCCIYPKGYIKPDHTHPFGQLLYVLKGTMDANGKLCKPGEMAWYPAETSGYHGATDEEEVMFLSINTEDPKKYF